MLHFMTDVYLHTNTSVFKIPVYVYHGRLKVSFAVIFCGFSPHRTAFFVVWISVVICIIERKACFVAGLKEHLTVEAGQILCIYV
jgi:hypothetical protein